MMSCKCSSIFNVLRPKLPSTKVPPGIRKIENQTKKAPSSRTEKVNTLQSLQRMANDAGG